MENSVSVLGSESYAEGHLYFRQDAELCGLMRADIKAEGRVTVASIGRVEGAIDSHSLDLRGSLKGEATIKGHVLLRSGCQLEGVLRCSSVEIEPNAHIDAEVFTEL